MENFLLKMDAFRKIPTELTNPTMHGAYLTMCAYIIMGLLFLMELTSYLSTSVSKTVELDPNYAENMWIDFDVIMHSLPCEYTKIVVRDIVGQSEIEILEQIITKEKLDARTGTFKGEMSQTDSRRGLVDVDPRNPDILLNPDKYRADNEKKTNDNEPTHIHDDNPELESDWISTSDHFHHDSFEKVLTFHDFTMINFYAEWCIHCRRFAPTWIEAEQKADKMHFRDKNRREVNAKLLRVNCVQFGYVVLCVCVCVCVCLGFLKKKREKKWFDICFISYIDKYVQNKEFEHIQQYDYIKKIKHMYNIVVNVQ